MARKVPKKPIDWLLLAAIIFPIIGSMMFLSAQGFIYDRQLADKPYVEGRILDGKRYTDEKSATILREAFEHSDTNKRELALKMEQMNTEYQTSNAKLAGKLDTLIEKVEGLKDDWLPRKHR